MAHYFTSFNGYKVKDADARAAIETMQETIMLSEHAIANAQQDVNLIKECFVTPQMFGAVADGQIDDTAAIQAAIGFVELNGGGAVFFPSGTYKISDTLHITADGVKLIGECMQSVYIKQTNVAKDAILLEGTEDDKLSGVTIEHMSFYCEGVSSAVGIHYKHCVNAYAEHLVLSEFLVGLKLTGTGNSLVQAVGVVSHVANAIGFQHGYHSASTQYNDIYAGFFGDAATTGFGFSASQGNIADFTINYLDVGNGLTGVYIDGAESPAEFPAADIRLYEIVCDNCVSRCIDIRNTGDRGNILIVGGWFNPARVATMNCLSIYNSSNVNVKGVTFQQVENSAPTFYGITGNLAKNVTIEGCQFINVFGCFSLATIERWNIRGNMIDVYGSDAVQNYAIYCNGATRCNVVDNIINGAYLGGILIDATSSKCLVAMNNVAGSTVTVSATESITENNLT